MMTVCWYDFNSYNIYRYPGESRGDVPRHGSELQLRAELVRPHHCVWTGGKRSDLTVPTVGKNRYNYNTLNNEKH